MSDWNLLGQTDPLTDAVVAPVGQGNVVSSTDPPVAVQQADPVAADLATLKSLSDGLSKEANKANPMESVETSLSRFVDDAFDMTRSEFDFQKRLQAHALTRLDKFTENQLIALLSNTGVNSADKISKTMNPWVQLATARQQAQIAAESAERTAAIQTGQSPTSVGGSAIRSLNESASKEVLQGVASLSQILEFAITAAKKQSEQPVTPNVTVVPDAPVAQQGQTETKKS